MKFYHFLWHFPWREYSWFGTKYIGNSRGVLTEFDFPVIKYLQFLGKHLSVLGEEQSWSEDDTEEVESLNLQLKDGLRKEVAVKPCPTIKLF
jgi:hypothetical protein